MHEYEYKYEYDLDVLDTCYKEFRHTDEYKELIGKKEITQFAWFNDWLRNKGYREVKLPVYRRLVNGESEYEF